MHAIDDSEKPYIEYLAGRAVAKVSPKRRHGIVQGRLWAILQELARGRGDVATEWRCYLPAERRRTSLVPDVAFISNERLAPLSEDEREMPQFAPDIAIEVRSADDKRKNLDWKTAAYLRHGAVLVLDVLPLERKIIAHTSDSMCEFVEGDCFTCDALPWLSFDVRDAFADLDK